MGATLDLFLSLMLWFILDENKSAIIFVDETRKYPVLDVVRYSSSSVNNDDCEMDDKITGRTSEMVYRNSSGISKLMIDQFFTEIEGPDRTWEQEDLGLFEENRDILILEL